MRCLPVVQNLDFRLIGLKRKDPSEHCNRLVTSNIIDFLLALSPSRFHDRNPARDDCLRLLS